MSFKLNQFCRNDGYNPSVKYDDPIIKKYVHKDYVSKIGETEDDFIIDQKPVLIDEYNIQKSIDEEAKTTDLKYLLKQLLLTGDESILKKRPGFYGDITQIQQSISNGSPLVKPEVIRESLPDEIKGLSVEQIAKMSDQDIAAYVAKVRQDAADLAAKMSTEKPVEQNGSEVK